MKLLKSSLACLLGMVFAFPSYAVLLYNSSPNPSEKISIHVAQNKDSCATSGQIYKGFYSDVSPDDRVPVGVDPKYNSRVIVEMGDGPSAKKVNANIQGCVIEFDGDNFYPIQNSSAACDLTSC